MQPELGKSTRRYSLPSYLNKDFIYGKANYSVDGGVAEALIHKDISRKQKKVFFPQNFVKLNAGAIKAGLVTSKVKIVVYCRRIVYFFYSYCRWLLFFFCY